MVTPLATAAHQPPLTQFAVILFMLKSKHRLLKKENYIRAGLPHTHTAFTFCQFWPQKISFMINRATAQMVLEGLHRSRKFVSLVA